MRTLTRIGLCEREFSDHCASEQFTVRPPPAPARQRCVRGAMPLVRAGPAVEQGFAEATLVCHDGGRAVRRATQTEAAERHRVAPSGYTAHDSTPSLPAA